MGEYPTYVFLFKTLMLPCASCYRWYQKGFLLWASPRMSNPVALPTCTSSPLCRSSSLTRTTCARYQPRRRHPVEHVQNNEKNTTNFSTLVFGRFEVERMVIIPQTLATSSSETFQASRKKGEHPTLITKQHKQISVYAPPPTDMASDSNTPMFIAQNKDTRAK